MKEKRKTQTVLKYKDFIFRASNIVPDRFDMYRIGTNQKTGASTQILVGYGYKFAEALQKLIDVEMGERNDVTDLKGYVAAYRKTTKEVQDALK